VGVLGFVLSVVSLGWQVHVYRESLTDKALVSFSVSFLNDDKEIISLNKKAKHRFDAELEPAALKKSELSAEVVNIGQRPLYIKSVRLIIPCPETGDSDSITFQPTGGSHAGALEPGAAIIYKAGPWNFSDRPLISTIERFCVTVESNKGFVTQTDEISYLSFSMSERLKSKFIKQGAFHAPAQVGKDSKNR
jgi:hypothetical protein